MIKKTFILFLILSLTHCGFSPIYNSDVKYVGTPGTDGAYAQIKIIPNGHPQTLYYFCASHPNMGGRLIIGSPHSTSNLIEGTNLYYTDGRARNSLLAGNNLDYDSSVGRFAVKSNPAFPNISGNVNISGHIMSSVDSSANLILRRTTASLAGAQTLGAIKFEGTDASNNDDVYGQIIGKTNTTTAGSEESEIEVKIRDAGGEHTGLTVGYNGTKLYHIGSQKLSTGASGVSITGTATATVAVDTPQLTMTNSAVVDSSVAGSAVASYVIDQFPAATYRTAKYLIQAVGASHGQSSELLLNHNGTTVNITQYATVVYGYSNDSDLITLDAAIAGGTLSLTATTKETNTTIKIVRTGIEA